MQQRNWNDAVHPGYGFLENAQFVKRLTEEGITFIGPSSDVITLLGDKIEARAAMEAAGLPVAKGSSEPISDEKVPVNWQKKLAILSSLRRRQVEVESVCRLSKNNPNLLVH